MARRNAGSPIELARMAANRKAGSRAQRRAQEAIERKSVPALKKLIRRNRQRQQ